MITLQIGNERRENNEIEERWIAQQIKKRRKDDSPTCIKATINNRDVNIVLTSGECSKSTGGGVRRPNRKESKLVELWSKQGLNAKDISPGNIISFLRQYRQYC